jgi:hypothetical protein
MWIRLDGSSGFAMLVETFDSVCKIIPPKVSSIFMLELREVLFRVTEPAKLLMFA